MSPRSLPIAYLFLALLGWAGGHRFYLRHYGWGFLYLISFGGFTIGIITDAFLLPGLVDSANRGSPPESDRLPQARIVEHRS